MGLLPGGSRRTFADPLLYDVKIVVPGSIPAARGSRDVTRYPDLNRLVNPRELQNRPGVGKMQIERRLAACIPLERQTAPPVIPLMLRPNIGRSFQMTRIACKVCGLG